jgi:hypothetical protein
MEPTETTPEIRAFCSECGARLDAGARYCHQCGVPIAGGARRAVAREGIHPALAWGVPAVAVIALVVIVLTKSGASVASTPTDAPGAPLAAGRAPDISALTPDERADRLFNRVMRLVSEGQKDSAAFFAPMALGAFEALAPLNAHRRYDVGLIALVTPNLALAQGQADSILAERPTHLLGLVLAARVAEAKKDAAALAAIRRRLVAAEPAERRAGLPEYTDHDADIRAALELARGV